jgi:putative transposase
MDLVTHRDPLVPMQSACGALGLPRASVYRRLRPRPSTPSPSAVRTSPRALSEEERNEVLAVLHTERFVDQPPREVYAALLAEGRYLCSVRTMYRVLAAAGEVRERRNQRAPQHHPVPRLEARAPNQVWTWDISKLATLTSGVFLNLYVVLDLYSRYIVAWMVALRENTGLAQHLIRASIERRAIPPGQLTLHNDRGAPMTAFGFNELLDSLGVEPSRSRPRVSNDNPYSESQFKTLKYQPQYPGRFRDIGHARSFLRRFVTWYNHKHRHTGLNGFTPQEVFQGRHHALVRQRQHVLDAAYAANPQRWINAPPKAPLPPEVVAINPAPSVDTDTSTPLANELVPAEVPIITTEIKEVIST